MRSRRCPPRARDRPRCQRALGQPALQAHQGPAGRALNSGVPISRQNTKVTRTVAILPKSNLLLIRPLLPLADRVAPRSPSGAQFLSYHRLPAWASAGGSQGSSTCDEPGSTRHHAGWAILVRGAIQLECGHNKRRERNVRSSYNRGTVRWLGPTAAPAVTPSFRFCAAGCPRPGPAWNNICKRTALRASVDLGSAPDYITNCMRNKSPGACQSCGKSTWCSRHATRDNGSFGLPKLQRGASGYPNG